MMLYYNYNSLLANAHHRGVDHGVLDAVDEQNRHPDQRETPELLDPEITGTKCPKKILRRSPIA
jgi:hypothetical protein